jgi:hypothetical protein
LAIPHGAPAVTLDMIKVMVHVITQAHNFNLTIYAQLMARVTNQDLKFEGLNIYEMVVLISLQVRQDRLTYMLEETEELHLKKDKPTISALRIFQESRILT